jgi:hypothetical protein
VPRSEPSDGGIPVLWMRGSYAGYTSYHTSLIGLLGRLAAPPPPAPAAAPEPAASPPPSSPSEARGLRPSALRIVLSRRIVTGRQWLRITGVLTDRASRGPLPRAKLVLYARDARTRRWRRVAAKVTDRHGRAVLRTHIRRATTFKLWFAGDATHAPTASRIQRVYFEHRATTHGPAD